MIGDKYKDFCYECNKNITMKHISNNRWNNPVYECSDCGMFFVDRVNEEDGM